MEFSRSEQLTAAAEAIERHTALSELLHKATQTHSMLSSHLIGLYGEVDKLAKGKTLVPATDLLIETVNSIIEDAKGLIYRDTYLDRLKQFVPAGDNPMYPDVLLSLRIVQESSRRFGSMLETENARHSAIGSQLRTIHMALYIAEQIESTPSEESEDDQIVEEDDEDVHPEEEDTDEDQSSDDDEDDEYDVLESDVRRHLDGKRVADDWFIRNYLSGENVFDFRKLDRIGLPKYVPPSIGITFVQHEK